MKIKKLRTVNFRGFAGDHIIPLNDKFTVVVGENASGKTSVIKALEVALGAYLQCLPLPKGEGIQRRQFLVNERYVEWNKKLKDYLGGPENTTVEVLEGEFSGKKISWSRELIGKNTTHSRKLAGELMDAVEALMEPRINRNDKSHKQAIVPIVASYGIERTVAQLKRFRKRNERRSRFEKAFLGALKETVDFDGVVGWLHNFESEIKYGREFPGTRQALFDAIQKAIPYLDDVTYNSYYLQLEGFVNIEEKHHGKKLHNNMSDGFKAMLNIVAELAYRCVVLNGFLGTEAVRQTPGIVMIDELDMHLHPNWQRHVVADLKNAFPNIQFVATTHSAFITQSLQADEIINLDTPKDINPNQLRVDEVATRIMGVESAYSQGNERLYEKSKKILTDIKQGKKPEEIQEEINDIHDPAVRAFLELNKKTNSK